MRKNTYDRIYDDIRRHIYTYIPYASIMRSSSSICVDIDIRNSLQINFYDRYIFSSSSSSYSPFVSLLRSNNNKYVMHFRCGMCEYINRTTALMHSFFHKLCATDNVQRTAHSAQREQSFYDWIGISRKNILIKIEISGHQSQFSHRIPVSSSRLRTIL